MHGEGFFHLAFVYLAAAVIAVPIAKRLGLGSVLGYLLAGMAIGPFGLSLLGDRGEDVMHFAEFGVVMMLFLIGLELQPSRLWRLRAPILGMGGLQVTVSALAIGAIALALGFDWRVALAIGLVLALSSTAIVLQTLAEKGLMRTDGGQSSFAVLLFQDIAVIPMLAVLPLLAAEAVAGSAGHDAHGNAAHATTWVDGLPAWAETLVVLGAVAAIIVAGRYLMRPIFRFIAKTRLRETFTAAALLLVIGIALLMSKVGLSPALGTFVAGVVLATSEYRHELEGNIEPFKGLLLGVFFISVGASVDFDLLREKPDLIALLVAGLILLKFLVLFVIGRVFRMGLDQNLIFAFSLAQGGEFAFVLFSFAIQNDVVPGNVVAPLIAVVAVTMALTPLLMLVNEKLLQPRIGTREVDDRPTDEVDVENPVIIAGFGRFGNVVGRLLRANGIGTTVLEYDSDRVDMLRRLGIQVFYGDASRSDLLHAAGAGQARLLVLAIDDHEKKLEIIHTVRKHFPGLNILARASGRLQNYELIDAGVTHIYRETLDTALRMGVDAMRMLGRRGNESVRAARTFRRHDEESIQELVEHRHDQKAYLSRARRRIQDMERAFADDDEDDDSIRDAGWDTESLREEFSNLED